MIPQSKPGRDILGAFIVFFVLILVTQLHLKSYISEFGDDEASHYISGLLIHDYLKSGFAMGPISYIKWYHSHYPLVGIGHWGPAFYGLEGVWMLIFSPSRSSVLLLSAVLATITATLIYWFGTTQLKLSRLAALFAGIAFVLCPIVQEDSSAVMLDMPITLGAFLSMIAYTRYMETGRWTYSVWFGLLAAVTMLIKGNGALLAVLPPAAIVLNRQWKLLARPSFWAAAVLVGVLVGPWYKLTYGIVAAGFRYTWGLAYTKVAVTENSTILLHSIGPVILLLGAIGLISGLGRLSGAPSSKLAGPGFKGIVALLIADWVFQSAAPAAIQDRYLSPLLPPLFLLAAVGTEALLDSLRQQVPSLFSSAAARGVVFAIVIISIIPAGLRAESKTPLGFRDLAKVAWANRTDTNPVTLIVAKESAEAAAVAELAMDDPARPSLFAVRGSRLLGGGGYNRTDYAPKFADAAQAAAAIDAAHVPLVLYQADPGGWAHVAQVDAARAQAAPPWQALAQAGSDRAPVTLYKRPQADGQSADIAAWLALTGPKGLQ